MSRSRTTTAAFIGMGALVAFSALTATPASASQTSTPADCSLSSSGSTSISMTCTDRPATQTWWIYAYCLNMRGIWIKMGNKVTGDGTSTVNCYLDSPESAWFASSS